MQMNAQKHLLKAEGCNEIDNFLRMRVSKAFLTRGHLVWSLESQSCRGEGQEHFRKRIQAEKSLEWSRNGKNMGVAGAS